MYYKVNRNTMIRIAPWWWHTTYTWRIWPVSIRQIGFPYAKREVQIIEHIEKEDRTRFSRKARLCLSRDDDWYIHAQTEVSPSKRQTMNWNLKKWIERKKWNLIMIIPWSWACYHTIPIYVLYAIWTYSLIWHRKGSMKGSNHITSPRYG